MDFNIEYVRTILYYCLEALDCPLSNNKTIAPRFMIVYNLPWDKYITNTSAGAIFSLSWRDEIVEISRQDNIETLLRYFFQYAGKVKRFLIYKQLIY